MDDELGLRNVAFEVNDLQAAVGWAATEGYGLVGGIGEYEGVWRMGLRPGAGRDHRLAGRAHRLNLATPAPTDLRAALSTIDRHVDNYIAAPPPTSRVKLASNVRPSTTKDR